MKYEMSVDEFRNFILKALYTEFEEVIEAEATASGRGKCFVNLEFHKNSANQTYLKWWVSNA